MTADLFASLAQLHSLDPRDLEEQVAALEQRLAAAQTLLTIVRQLRSLGSWDRVVLSLQPRGDLEVLGPDLPTTTDLGRQELREAGQSDPVRPTTKQRRKPITAAVPPKQGQNGASSRSAAKETVRQQSGVESFPEALEPVGSVVSGGPDGSAAANDQPPFSYQDVSPAAVLAAPPKKHAPGTYSPEYLPSVDHRDPPERPAGPDQPPLKLTKELYDSFMARRPLGTDGRHSRCLTATGRERVFRMILLIFYGGPQTAKALQEIAGSERSWLAHTLKHQPQIFRSETHDKWGLTEAATNVMLHSADHQALTQSN